jgi:hypothetical protein
VTKYKVRVYIEDNGKKIAAIKAWRTVTGCGLTAGKAFIEDANCRTVTVIMNETQFAKLAFASVNDCKGTSNPFRDDMRPLFRIDGCDVYTGEGFDFSSLEPRYETV